MSVAIYAKFVDIRIRHSSVKNVLDNLLREGLCEDRDVPFKDFLDTQGFSHTSSKKYIGITDIHFDVFTKDNLKILKIIGEHAFCPGVAHFEDEYGDTGVFFCANGTSSAYGVVPSLEDKRIRSLEAEAEDQKTDFAKTEWPLVIDSNDPDLKIRYWRSVAFQCIGELSKLLHEKAKLKSANDLFKRKTVSAIGGAHTLLSGEKTLVGFRALSLEDEKKILERLMSFEDTVLVTMTIPFENRRVKSKGSTG